ncbi:polysaccharide ABC transporter ATP-binding protein [Marinicella sediminis]|uniref:Polysaccharide ABC transporter ATP-binding protein n=1 Tax=Marinicella sediminis TaxID=1792834 RepID=A0ABV7J8Z2_9GAMM|nr:polysaccharide ABC transporter ATP-binding protein [Marinicella sediminis]
MKLLQLKHINKIYPHVANNKQRVRGMLNILFNRQEASGAHVLKDIDLTVNQGESLAIIGHNGAGKSTLLKIISGVIQPTSGKLSIDCGIGALLELGSGFDPEYSGIDNLKMAAAMAGLTGEVAKTKIHRMIEFADIGDYINEPVKNYSSGMVVRLGFSVITETKPELLITDEILAVGDEGFQLKCLNWIDQYLSDGGTLLLVSHSIYHVQKLCRKAIWLDHGAVKLAGDVFTVSQAYQASITDPAKLPSGAEVNRSTYHIYDAHILVNDEQHERLPFNSDVELLVQVYTPDEQIPGICFGIATQQDQPVYGTYSELHQARPVRNTDGLLEYRISLPGLKLLPGHYEFKFHCMTPENIQMIDTFKKMVQITGESREHGPVQIETRWQ